MSPSPFSAFWDNYWLPSEIDSIIVKWSGERRVTNSRTDLFAREEALIHFPDFSSDYLSQRGISTVYPKAHQVWAKDSS